MKLTCLQENLARGLASVGKAVSVKAPLPVLENILLTATKGELTLSATDLKLGIIVKVGAKVEEEGALAVPARVLSELIASLPKTTIALSEKAKVLQIQAPQVDTKINGLGAEEFPRFASLPKKPFAKIKAKALAEAVAKTSFASATDDSRPILTGLLLQIKDRQGVLVGVDGFRLAEYRLPFADSEDWRGVIPAKAMHEVARLFSANGEVSIYDQRESGEVIFAQGDILVYVKLLDGEFPDYKKIIPQDFVCEASVSVEEFGKSVKTASIFASLEAGGILKMRASPKEGLLELSAVASEVGENNTAIDAKVLGREITVAMNNKFITGYLAGISGESELVLKFSGELSPLRFASKKNSQYLYIAMPARVQD